MDNLNSIDYNKAIQAYSKLLERLNSGKMDEEFYAAINYVYRFAQTADQDMREQMEAEIYSIVRQQDDIGMVFSMFSFLLRLSPEALYLEEFLTKIRSLQKICALEWKTVNFYYKQLNLIRLHQPQCDTENVRTMLSELVSRGVTRCMRTLNVAVSPKPYENRNEKRAVILTEEFLENDSEHREQVLECCYQLQHMLGKTVLLINTAESASRQGEVSFFGAEYGEKDESLQEISQVEWKGEKIEYFQCGDVFSEVIETERLIKKILEFNPGMALHIGDNSFFAGIIDEWIPVLSIGGTYGKYVVSATEFQAAFESRQEIEQEILAIVKNYEQTIRDERNLKLRLVFPADYFQDEDRYVGHDEQGTWEEYRIHPGRKKIWAAELAMLKEFIRICEKYDITYFAYKGTLLGAVRHNGFIPWDDDIDVVMKREDYKKFMEVAPGELEERFCLMDASIVPQWEELKIRILCKSDAETLYVQGRKKLLYLPAIDIAVLDYLPKDSAEAKRQQEILKDIFLMMWRTDYSGQLVGHSRLEFEELKKSLGYEIDESASVRNQIAQLHQLVVGQNQEESSGKLYHSIEFYALQKWREFPEKWFYEVEKLPFENQIISVPRLSSEVLDMLYGSSWQEPVRTVAHLKEDEYLKVDKSQYNEEELLEYKKDFLEEETRKLHFTGYNRVNYFHIERKMKCAWAASLKVLKEVERVCKRNGILYFVDWGSLLGAVRHQGYIPWDDDIDIAMKRDDYNRFLEIAKDELPKDYYLVDEVFDEKWVTNVSRVINVPSLSDSYVKPHTEKEEEFFGCPYIIGIDIYQLDYYPLDKEEAQLQIDLFANAIKIKYDLRENGNQMTEEIEERVKSLGEVCNYQFTNEISILSHALKLIGAISQLYGPEDGEELANMYSRFQTKRFRLRKEWFEDSVSLPFETTTVEVPKDYMKVLTEECGLYWDCGYMGGTGHDYPFYKKQERDLEKQGVILP